MEYVAFQYAIALFQLATEKDEVEDTLKDFKELFDLVNPDFYTFMEHPNMKKREKKALIEKMVHTPNLKYLCYVLIDKHHMDLLSDVLVAYQDLINQDHQIMKVNVFSNKPINETETKELVLALKKRFSKVIQLHNIVDKDIIGGLRLEYNGAVLDDTVGHYFKALQTRLTK